MLDNIRQEWRAKNLIQRVVKLLQVDPSSACQRIFNAAVHDLKDKIVIAGLDIAEEAAKQHKLPPVSKSEDIENYSVSRTIDLSYRMGLLSRPEYKRFSRAYDIRRDLEHEDDVYEAGLEDCVYIFKTCIDVVLSKDPVRLLKLVDIKDIVENPEPTFVGDEVIEDYRFAPVPRQTEIYKFLVGTSLDKKQPDIVRQNSYNALHSLREFTSKEVLIELARLQVEKIARNTPDHALVRVCHAAGTFAYLKKSQILAFYKDFFKGMSEVGYHWTKNNEHSEVLRSLKEVGGLRYCPAELLGDYCEWLVLCYIGEPGGYGAGAYRNVFYSNSGAPISLDLLKKDKVRTLGVCEGLEGQKEVKLACKNQHVSRRFENIIEALA